jgi:hypothetical protein
MRPLLGLLIAATVAVASAACAKAPILDWKPDRQGCNPNTEHDCAGSGCCLLEWTCGGPQQGMPATCPEGMCCDEEETVDAWGARRMRARRMMRMRAP